MSATIGNDTLSGSNGNDSIDLLAGNDSYLGLGGNDSIFGNDGTDTIYGGNGADSIAGGNGDDRIYGEAGSDTIDAGAGTFDSILYNQTGGEAITANISLLGPNRGGSNVGTVATATQGTDSVINFEAMNGSTNNDTFNISDAATFYASLFVFANTGNDTITNSADPYGPYSNVFADYDAFSAANLGAGFTRGVSVDLQTGTDTLGRPIGSATDYAGTDRLVGVRGVAATSLNDTIYGTAFADRFRPYAGNDIVDGRDGFDMVDYGTNSSSQAVSVNFVTGRANDGRGGADTLISIEAARGGSGSDTLLGNVFSEAFRGNAGNDSIDGGLGSDRIEYFDASATSGVSVNLITGTATDGRGGIDTFTSIENVYGGELNDYLVGVGQDGQTTSRLRGDAGSDTLVGIDGEYVVADYSSQTVGLSVNLASGSVNDGLGGVDSLINIRGAIMYGNFADTLIGSNEDDWLAPSGGNDSIVGGDGFDVLAYSGNPTSGVSVNLATRTASDGDGGTDAFTGIEAVLTGYSNDTVIGDSGFNAIVLGAGADYADAAGGTDVVSYRFGSSPGAVAYTYNESGNGRLFSGVTIDLAAGRATDYGGSVDTILNFEYASGSSMHDSILGSSGDNELEGSEGNDTINGGAGNDTIWKGAGNDLLMGDAGNDLYRVDAATGRVIIDDASGNDTVDFGGEAGREIFTSDISSVAGIEAFDLVGSGNILHLTAARAISASGTGLFRVFGGGADRIIFDDTGWVRTGSSGGFDTLSNSAGNATVIASTGLASSDIGSVIDAGDGNDTIIAGNGADTIDGGNGSDIIAGFGGNDSILGGTGDDSINGGNGDDTVLRSHGNDLIQGGNGNDDLSGAGRSRLFGGDGNDILKVELVEAGTLMGDGGDDTLIGTPISLIAMGGAFSMAGGEGNDSVTLGASYMTAQVTGGNGDDVLSVGAGVETVDGGAGNDTIIAHNTPVTFSDGADSYMGGNGIDLLSYEGLTNATQGVTVNLAASVTSGSLGNDSLSGIENVLTGAGNDSVLGNGVANILSGGNGDDTLVGGAGADTVLGGLGNDLIQGGNGNARLAGGDGADTLVAGGGNETLLGGGGDDLYLMAASADADPIIDDASGNDTVSLVGGGVNEISAIAVPGELDGITGIEAFDLAGTGSRLGLTRTAVIALSDTDVLRVYGSGNDSLVFEDTGWNRGATADGFVTFTNGSATVLAVESLVSVVAVPTTGNDALTGTSGNDVIDLLAGNDSYLGLDGNDAILGNDGNDTIYGGNGADSIAGGNDNDVIFGEAGSDTIDAGAGTSDSIRYNQTGGEAITATITSSGGNTGINTATVSTATQGTDSIQGFEALIGSINGDLITVTTAATRNVNLFLFGGAGNDTIIDNYLQNGVFADYNTSSANLTGGISVDLTSGIATDGFGGIDSLVGITAVNGTSFADTMLGSASNDRFRGWQGNDLMDGRGGTSDMADYAANAASQAVSVNLATGSANDGLGGTDTLISIEQVRGGAGDDRLIGDSNNNTFRGNGGNDTIDGAGGTGDAVEYGFATAAVSVNLATGQAQDGQGGIDSLVGIENVYGSAYADTLIGGNGNDYLRGDAGKDTLDGGAGTADVAQYANATTGITANMVTGIVQDGQGGTDSLAGIEQIWGSGFNDSMLGGNGADFFVGSTGADTFDGGLGVDAVNYFIYTTNFGSPTQGVSVDLATGTALDAFGGLDRLFGIEIIEGSSFADTITGGAGNDIIRGNGGADSLSGGAGNDQIYAFGPSDVARLDGGAGNDLLQGSAANDTMSGGDDADTLYGNGGADSLIGGNGSDYLYAFGTVAVTLAGGAGNDQLAGATGNDTLDGGDDADTLYGQGGADSYSGGAGADHLYAGNGADTMDGGIGNDSLYGNGGADSLSGGEGDDEISAFGFADAVRFDGGAGNDKLYDGSGADTMVGGAGNDTIYSTAGADSVNGGDGDDNIDAGGSVAAVRLDGGVGHDTLYAGFVTGGSGGNSLSGGTGNDLLQVGQYGSNSLSGGDGNDTLDGGAGNDTLSGGIGNDLYFVNYTSDQIIELTGGGADTIITSVTISMPDQLEALQIAAGITGITLTGGAGNDMLVGNGLANNLNGGAGDDVILAGNVTLADIYALFGP
jgi:Ca2+-binding RTX toxin-like protein